MSHYFETLESCRLLTVFHPSAAVADADPGSLRDAVIAANGNHQNNTIDLTGNTYDLTLANPTGQENSMAALADRARRAATTVPAELPTVALTHSPSG